MGNITVGISLNDVVETLKKILCDDMSTYEIACCRVASSTLEAMCRQHKKKYYETFLVTVKS